jgi:hypothetical protein
MGMPGARQRRVQPGDGGPIVGLLDQRAGEPIVAGSVSIASTWVSMGGGADRWSRRDGRSRFAALKGRRLRVLGRTRSSTTQRVTSATSVTRHSSGPHQ